MNRRIIALTTLLIAASCSTVLAQTTTPGGGPEPGLKDYVHPPSLSAPDVGQRASSPPPKLDRPINSSTTRLAHPRKPKGARQPGKATGGPAGSSSAPH